MYRLSIRAVVEGPTDKPFFDGLLQRALDQLCLSLVEPVVEVDVATWRPRVVVGQSRHEAVLGQVRAVFPHVDVVFLHVDGTSRPERELKKYFTPLEKLWRSQAGLPVLLPLVPVREMEAWALADRHLLEQLVRRVWSPSEVFEGERLGQVEQLSDPKRTLAEIVALAPRGRQNREATDYLPLLAERISLRALERVPSFAAWSRDTRAALIELMVGE